MSASLLLDEPGAVLRHGLAGLLRGADEGHLKRLDVSAVICDKRRQSSPACSRKLR
jgi:hypothetical protein